MLLRIMHLQRFQKDCGMVQFFERHTHEDLINFDMRTPGLYVMFHRFEFLKDPHQTHLQNQNFDTT